MLGGNFQTLVGRKTGGIKVRWRESLDVMRKSDLPLMVFFINSSVSSQRPDTGISTQGFSTSFYGLIMVGGGSRDPENPVVEQR